MTRTRHLPRRAATVAVAAVAALAAAPMGVASADTALTATAVCYAEGAGSFFCWSNITGGTAPYTAVWTGAPFTEAGSGTCTPGRAYRVSVTVTDAAAARVTAPASFICKGGPPL